MNASVITPQRQSLLSRFVTVAGVEYHVEIYGYGSEETWWFQVERQREAGGSIWAYQFGGSVPFEDDRSVLDALRSGLRDPRSRMRHELKNWQAFKDFAAQEPAGNVKGSKRGYYTRLANESLADALKQAPRWRLAKQLWKEITRL